MVKHLPQSELIKCFYYRLAIIQVRAGETKVAAWERHLMETPDDIHATIKIFNS